MKKHRKLRGLFVFLATLGLAAVAIAAWVGLLQMPFQGSTVEAPGALNAYYPSGITSVRATGLAPLTVPALGAGDWTFAFTRVNSIAFEVNGSDTVSAVMKFVPTGTPSAELLEAVHWRLGWASALNDLPGFNSNNWPVTNAYTVEGTLDELVATGYAFPANLTPATTAVLKLAFWLDKDAPQSVAGQTFNGTLDVTTTLVP